MIGIVVVSHSSRLAEGVVELAREMGGAEVAVEAAGGLGPPAPGEALGSRRPEVAERTAPSEALGGRRPEVAERTGGAALGTSATEVLAAIERAWSDDGVLVLMDLGSAVLSAETALDLLAPKRRERVLLCAAPLVEGAVAAAAAARAGRALPDVAAEAGGALAPKAAQLGAAEPAEAPARDPGGGAATVTIRVQNPLGLHARPIASLIATATPFRAEVEVTNLTLGRGPASARSLSALATLGVARGHEVLIAARGPQASEALEALQHLAAEGFGEPLRPDLSPVPEPPGGDTTPEASGPFCLNGLPASPGVARGQARHLRSSRAESLRAVPGDPETEWQRVLAALAGVRAELESARDALSSRGAGDEAGILDAQILLLEDPALLEPARRRVIAGGRDGARAWGETVEEAAAGLRSVADGYLRARADDLAGLARRVREHMAGDGAPPPAVRVSAPGILIAADLSPGEAASLDPLQVFGVATATGGPTSHAAIVARALGIPAVAGLGDPVLGVPEGTELLLDGEGGLLYGDPSRELSAAYRFRAAALENSARKARSRAREPAVTRDGLRVEVLANVGRLGEVGGALEAGADGVGLVRTELLFPGGGSPGEEEQELAYRSLADGLEGRLVVLRTFDLGGDKPPADAGGGGAGAGAPAPGEANPFLGLRGIRYALAHPDLLRTQLAAVLRAGAGRRVKVMVPMVSTVEELRSVKDLLETEQERLAALGVPVADPLELGAMVEVPAAALAARQLAQEADFLSIGTNDLAQYAMAADRGNPAVARLADYLHPAVLVLIRGVVEAGARSGRPVGLCGEAGSDPAALPLLVGLGLRQVSVAPGSIPAVKESIRGLDASQAAALAVEAQGLGSAEQVRRLVAERLAAPARPPRPPARRPPSARSGGRGS